MNLSNRFGFGRAKGMSLAGDEPAPADAIVLNGGAVKNRTETLTPEVTIRTLHHLRDKAEREAYNASLPVKRKGLLERLGLRRTKVADPFEEVKAPKVEPKPKKPKAKRKVSVAVAAEAKTPPAVVAPKVVAEAKKPVALAELKAPLALAELKAPLAPAKAAPVQLAELKAPAVPAKPRERAAKPKVAPAIPPRPAQKKKRDRSDFVVGGLGAVLGLTCALFPWYIFFNQEKFGVREFVFEGRGSMTAPSQVVFQPALAMKPISSGEVPKMQLDFFPTATVPAEEEQMRAVPASEQPFPSDLIGFRLVHVANGRAMIQDGDGLWVVQRGSRLPDASTVASIEQRDGHWVLVTTLDRVVELER